MFTVHPSLRPPERLAQHAAYAHNPCPLFCIEPFCASVHAFVASDDRKSDMWQADQKERAELRKMQANTLAMVEDLHRVIILQTMVLH